MVFADEFEIIVGDHLSVLALSSRFDGRTPLVQIVSIP